MKYAKAFAALIGSGLTPSAIIGFLTVFHVSISAGTAAAIYAVAAPILGTLFVVGGPANKMEKKVAAAVEPVIAKVAPVIAEAAPVVAKVAAEVDKAAAPAAPSAPPAPGWPPPAA